MPRIEIIKEWGNNELASLVVPDTSGTHATHLGDITLDLQKGGEGVPGGHSKVTIDGEVLRGHGKHKTRSSRQVPLMGHVTLKGDVPPRGEISLGRGKLLKVRMLGQGEVVQPKLL